MAIPNTNVVFIDTTLDTHLALVVSDIDTVSDLKKSILSEHPLCFPKIGQIQIHGIKVERKGYFYHLTDSMPVRSVFSGVNESWFVSVDVSVLGECAQNEHLFSHGSPNQMATPHIANNALIVCGSDAIGSSSKRVSTFGNFKLPRFENRPVENEEIPVASPRVSENTGKGVKSSGDNDTGTHLPGSVPETENHCFVNPELPSLNIESEVDGSGKGIKDDCNVCEETPFPKKIRKSKRKKEEDTVRDGNSKDDTVVDNALSFPSKRASGTSNEVPGSRIECKEDRTNEGIEDACVVHEEGNCKSVSNVKKKQKSKRRKEDKVQDGTSKVNDASVVGSGEYAIQQDVEVVANPLVDADKEVIKETEVLKEHQHTDCNNNNTKNDIDVAAASMQEALELGSASNKKRKKRKRSLTVDSNEMSKVETAIQKDEVHKSDEEHKERKESKDQFELKNEKSRDDVEHKQDQLTENILDTGPPAKKKRKGKEKSGEKSLSKAKLINDFNGDNTSHHILEDQQKTKDSNADQSAEHFADASLLRTSVLQGRRKKGKINSSNPHETPVVTSSRKDEDADRSSIQRGGQEEISENGLSKDISMSKATIDNMETGTDACKEGFQSTERTTGNYKNHSDIEIKAHTADVDEPMELTENNENVVLDQCHKNKAGQIEGAEEGRGVSPQNLPKLMLLEKSTSFKKDKTDANIGELNVTSKVVDANGMTEPIKSEKDKRTRKVKNSSGGTASREGIGLVDASESESVIMKSLSAKNCDPMPGNTETKENPLNQTEGEKIQQEEVKGTSDKEDDFSVDNAGSLEQIKTKSNAEHVGKRQGNKLNNKQTSASKSISNMPTKDQVRDSKKLTPSSVSGTHGKPSVAVTKSKSTSMKSTNKSSKNDAIFSVRGVASKTQQKKSLLSGAIFMDDSSSTSEGEVDNSDASTRTPSDNPLLSDLSDGDSSSGSYGRRSPENGARSSLKTSLSGLSIDHVLRGSIRFKKAITTASLLEETQSQSQPPEFVPDSLAE